MHRLEHVFECRCGETGRSMFPVVLIIDRNYLCSNALSASTALGGREGLIQIHSNALIDELNISSLQVMSEEFL